MALKVALVQITAGPDPSENARINRSLLDQAATEGADFILFPEVCNMIEPDRVACRAKATASHDDKTLISLQEGARSERRQEGAQHCWRRQGPRDPPPRMQNRQDRDTDKEERAGNVDCREYSRCEAA